MPQPRVSRFVGDGTGVTITQPQCLACRWFDAAHPERARCRVFPDGIPLPILTNKADHRKPYPGDRGFRFEPKDVA